MILYFVYLLVFAGKAANIVRKNDNYGVLLGNVATQETYTKVLHFIPYRFMAMIVQKRRNRESDVSIS